MQVAAVFDGSLTTSIFVKGLAAVTAAGVVSIGTTIYTIGGRWSTTELRVQQNTLQVERVAEKQEQDHETLVRIEERQKVIIVKQDRVLDKLDEVLRNVREE